MNLEQLTKHQIILLTLLVSFVTSIATGIVTVSLMDQAPAGVTRVVNQIVEHTVEKVIPATQGAAAVTTTEKTVVVKDDDLAAQSIAKVQKSMIRIVAKGGDTLIARGLIIDSKGAAITDKSALTASTATEFEAILPSGERFAAVPRTAATTTSLLYIDVAVGTSTGFAPAVLADATKLSLGQSVIRIGGGGADTVGSGVIATLPSKDNPNLIQASVSSATSGSVLMTLFGEVIGIYTADNDAGSYTLAAQQKATVQAPANPPPSTTGAPVSS
ncbi:MAG TPA: trypsin-like peptidase domain-containing protein [Candidatus Paceibacterota bacterium]|nr:trypsin-like peptidase domain-containing protein [Candidatus Paceibacterota bacterium]